jgi:CRISPR/Cas system-associated exonuclease Cas4 (RecB family)
VGFIRISDTVNGKSSNSPVAQNFKSMYDKIVFDKYQKEEQHVSSRTFAPSSFRCDRLSFFRLRGVPADENVNVDSVLSFSAVLGTAMHREIQSNLKEAIGDNWINVPDFLKTHDVGHDYKIGNSSEFETQLEFKNPPVRFSCDGLIKIGETVYLLEIKSSNPQPFSSLYEPKPNHIDQVKCYCALMNIDRALVLYQDRMYGQTKCFEVDVPDSEKQAVFDRMDRVMYFVNKCVAPPRLPKGDYWCTYCKYKKRCDSWG